MKIALRGKHNQFTDELMTAVQERLSVADVTFWPLGEAPPANDFELILALGKLGPEEMDQLPRLAFIQTVSDGYDAVDVDAATDRGIWVSYSPGEATGNADSVAEYAVFLILAATRRVGVALRSITDPQTSRPMLNRSMVGMQVLIVGWGSIGERVGARLGPFGVTLSAVDRKPEIVPAGIKAWPLDKLDDALAEADIAVICLRGTDENTHLFDAGRFAAMKPGAMLVNIARGTLVDEPPLLAAIHSGHIAGAGLDVEEHEPIQPGDPLLAVPEIFVTPHIAGFTTHTLRGSVDYIQQVVDQFRAGTKIASILNHPKHPRKPLTDAAPAKP